MRYNVYIRRAGTVGDATIQRTDIEADNGYAALKSVVDTELGGVDVVADGNGWERHGNEFSSNWSIGVLFTANVTTMS